MDDRQLLERIVTDPNIFGGKPVIRGRRLAVEHVLGMLAAGDETAVILEHYPWLERDDVRACLLFARRLVGQERWEPFPVTAAP
jgi:uncharacterized protein (DUF433 family)